MLIVIISSLLGLVLGQYQPHCTPGREGGVIVHLFSWRWTDIAKECEQFLGPSGFCGVQVSPPNEHRIVTNPNRPWWERYQPISYKLDSSSGNRKQFIDMVDRCNAAGVRVYADVVINHMCAADAGEGYGSGGSYYNTQFKEFRGVPYGEKDFSTKCPTFSGNIEDYYNDVKQARDCRLLNLMELDGGSDYVQSKIVGYLDDMLNIGIDGIRVDASKHMWPGDLMAIINKTIDTKSGDRPFVYHEVIDMDNLGVIRASHYQHIGRVTEFNYGIKMSQTFKSGQQPLTTLKTVANSLLADDKALVFIDNHDNQRAHGGAGDVITFKNPIELEMAIAFMLSWPYGVPRIMSSYNFTEDWTGPPKLPPGEDKWCKNGWVCEHRWKPIKNMVAWRNSAGSSKVENWWSNGNNQIAYSRGTSAFIAFNKQDGQLDEWLTTGLPSGTYCDIISGDLIDGKCTGKTIIVKEDGSANIQINNGGYPMVAIHKGSFLTSDTSGVFG